MAFTAPKTWSTDEMVTAAKFNIDVKDNSDYLKTEVDKLSIILSASYTSTSRDLNVVYQNITAKGLMVCFSSVYSATSAGIADATWFFCNSTATPNTTTTAYVYTERGCGKSTSILVAPDFYYEIKAGDPTNHLERHWYEWTLF